jgi:hypothetical protein
MWPTEKVLYFVNVDRQCYSYHRKMPFGLQAFFVGVHRSSLRIALKLRVKLFSNF